MKRSSILAAAVAGLIIFSGCAQKNTTPEQPLPDGSSQEETSDVELQEVSSAPYSFEIPAVFESPDYTASPEDRYTDRWDYVNEDGKPVIRVAIAPFVTETAHADDAKGLLQARFLFSANSDFSTEDDVEIDIEGSDESYASPFFFVGEDGSEYGGFWWMTWDSEKARSSAVELQYDMEYEDEADEVINIIADSIELHPDTYTEDGPGVEF